MRPQVATVEARRTLIGNDSVSPDWTWLNQVHGNQVWKVSSPGDHAGAEGDAAVTEIAGAVITVRTADCAPIALVAENGAIGVVHAGWRGLVSGVVDAAVEALRELAPGPIEAWLGPCIHAECYEFSPEDLQGLVDRFGPTVASTTMAGAPAFDLPAAVEVALVRLGIQTDTSAAACTACGGAWFSHRARRDEARQVLAAWIESEAR